MSETTPSPEKPFRPKRFLLILSIVLSPLLVWFLLHFHPWDRSTRFPVRTTLMPLAFEPLPLGSVKPTGWILEQLKLQANGLSGHLDEFWPDIKDSGWIGGGAEGWERGPYWLDGVIPLAYLTDDAKLKAKITRWVDYILLHQNQDGWLGPNQGNAATGSGAPPNVIRDPWPQFIILKALIQYQEATGDVRILPAVQKSLENLKFQLDDRHLFNWNYFRWADLLVSSFWLFDRTGEPWLLDLSRKAAGQGYDWRKHFSDLPLKEKSIGWNWTSHVVNNAMGLKAPALLYRLTGAEAFKRLAPRAFREIERWHGEANGLFSGDECLAGKSPSQGTELCAIVEEMFSLETSLSVLGNVEFADRLEKIAFNALPAAFSRDYWQHQYVEQANQVACVPIAKPIYTTNTGDANLFGLEPHYGCCTANMHQGWPKLVSHLWMKSPDGGLAAVIYAPSTVETVIAGVKVRVELATDYPFSGSLTLTVRSPQPVEFPLYLRIPAWTKAATVKLPDGSVLDPASGSFCQVRRQWSGEETLVLNLPMAITLREGFHKSISVERGPLVYSLGLKEQWKVFEPFPFQPPKNPKNDMAVLPQTPWNYGLEMDREHPERSLTLKEGVLKGNPFTLEGAPIHLSVKGKRLNYWLFEQGAAQPPPESPAKSSETLEDLVLVPYGSTRLRVTEFPVLGK